MYFRYYLYDTKLLNTLDFDTEDSIAMTLSHDELMPGDQVGQAEHRGTHGQLGLDVVFGVDHLPGYIERGVVDFCQTVCDSEGIEEFHLWDWAEGTWQRYIKFATETGVVPGEMEPARWLEVED